MRLNLLIGIILLLLVVAPVAAQEDNLLLFPLTRTQQIDACTTATFAFEATNVGTYADTFIFSVNPLGEATRINGSVSFLQPGESRTITATILPPCGLYGEQEVNVIGEAQSTGIQFYETFTLDLLPTNVPIIAEGIERVRVTYDRSGVEVAFKNLGDVDTIYEVSVEGEPWMEFAEEEILVPAKGSKNVQLITSPNNITVLEGVYPATIVATVKTTGVEYAKVLEFNLHIPRWHDIFIDNWWLTPLILVVLLVLILLFKRWLAYREETKDERLQLKEEKRREKEARRAEKQKQKEAKQKEREALKAAKQKERDQARKEKEKIREAHLKERAALRAKGDNERDEAKRLKLIDYLTKIFLRDLRQEYKYNLKPEGQSSKWKVLVAVVLIAIIAAIVVAWDTIMAYLVAVGAGILAAIVVIVLLAFIIKAKREGAKRRLSEKDLNHCREEAKKILREDYDLIRKDYLSVFHPAKSWGKIIGWTILTVLLLAGSALAYTYKAKFLVWAWMALTLVPLVLALLIILVFLIKRKLRASNVIEREYGELPVRFEYVSTGKKLGFGELSFKLKSKVESALLRISSLKRNPVFLDPEGKVFSYFMVEHIGFEDKDVEKANFRFAVKQSWLDRWNIPAKNVKLLRHHNGKWSQVQTCRMLHSDGRLVFYEASHGSLSVFAIVGTPQEPKEATEKVEKVAKSAKKEAKPKREVIVDPVAELEDETPGKWQYFMYLGVAVLALIIFLAPLYLNIEAPQEDTLAQDLDEVSQEVEAIANTVAGIDEYAGIPTQTWDQNEENRLDLSEYFLDPDNETLEYTNSNLDHITITYEGNFAVFSPEQDWTGEEVVVFTATDSNNATVDSNPVRLVVKQEQEEEVDQFVQDYGTYVLLALVFLVILLIASSLFRRGTDLLDNE
ncbi:MAG: PGF-pre-PGF domain-containing protein [Candidatus Nanoarchaeia archaeon]